MAKEAIVMVKYRRSNIILINYNESSTLFSSYLLISNLFICLLINNYTILQYSYLHLGLNI